MSSNVTSVVFKSRFNSLKQIYYDFCHMCTGRSEVETKIDYIYIYVCVCVCDNGTLGYRLTDYCIFLLQK